MYVSEHIEEGRKVRRLNRRVRLWAIAAGSLLVLSGGAAFAAGGAKVGSGDTALGIGQRGAGHVDDAGAGAVLRGMVRRKNVLATIMQSFIMVGLVSVLWSYTATAWLLAPTWAFHWVAQMDRPESRRPDAERRLCGDHTAPGRS